MKLTPGRVLLFGTALATVLAVWYLFRPDTLVTNTRVDEPPIAAEVSAPDRGEAPAKLVARGRFHDVRHAGSGEVTIHRRADGTHVLRLSELAVDNGPDLYVYLIAAADARDNDAVTRSGFVSLGRLKGNRGNQNYEIPVQVDLSRYHAVSIWCRRFGANFATAPLKMM